MVKRKSSLWLNKPKVRHRKPASQAFIQSTAKTCTFLSPSVKSWKRIVTPLKGSTPKRSRIHSPLKRITPGSSFEKRSHADIPGDVALFRSVLKKLAEKGLQQNFLKFLEVIDQGKFPLDNICFLLLLETAQFYAGKCSSQMRYSDTTKRFWKLGYRLFHAKFLYFMGGAKHLGQVTGDISSGDLNPVDADINFAVPSVNTLESFDVSHVDIPKTTQPGVILPILKSLKQLGSRQYMLCADGKKVTSGVDTKGGDVDMFGHEQHPTLKERQELLENQKVQIGKLPCDDGDSSVFKLHGVVTIAGSRMKDARELTFRQTFGLEKFKKMAGPDLRTSKYQRVISMFHASLHQLNEFLNETLGLVNELLEIASQLNDTRVLFTAAREVDQSFQSNMLTLWDDDQEHESLDPRILKQRTEPWFLLRKKARVTGSSLHDALGLRNLKLQKQHFDVYVKQKETNTVIEPELQKKFDHGTQHEIDAIATLVGKIMPSYFPNCTYVEEGCYVICGNSRDVLGVVSPDGSVRQNDPSSPNGIGKTVAAIEIKCPFPSGTQLPVHYTLPDYYVMQCLAEMKVLEVDLLLFISYSEKSTTFFKVRFSAELWDMAWDEVVRLYDVEDPQKQTKTNPMMNELRSRITEFTKTNVEFLCEVQSCRMISSGLCSSEAGSPFLHSWTNNDSNISPPVRDLAEVTAKALNVVQTGYNLLRKKASEIMVWVLTDKDRNSRKELPCTLPIAYGLKDYRLTATEMRNATEEVLDQCDQNGLDILTFYTDGQWIQLMARDKGGQPLTVYQLQKDTWKRVLKNPKQALVKKIEEVHHMSNSGQLLDATRIDFDGDKATVELKDASLFSISTCNDPEVWKKKTKRKKGKEVESTATEETSRVELQTAWLPDQVVDTILNSDNEPEMLEVLSDVSREVMAQDPTLPQEEPEDIFEELGFDSLESLALERCLHQDNLTASSPNNVERNSPVVEDITMEAEDIVDYENLENNSNPDDTEASTSTSTTDNMNPESMDCDDKLIVEPCNISDILDALKNDPNTAKKWENVHCNLTEKIIRQMRHKDLNVVYDNVKQKLPLEIRVFKTNWVKDTKCDFILGVLGFAEMPNIEKYIRVKRWNPSSLRKLSIDAISAKSYPKAALSAAYARHVFPDDLKEWQTRMPFPSPIGVSGLDETIQFWFSYPEKRENGKLLCKGIDCSHNLTHMRVRTCTTGLCGVSPEAWKEYAKSNETKLSVPHVDDLIDKQNVPNARTNFCEEVEEWMTSNGYVEAAELTRIIRNWYDASDEPGIPAVDRVRHLLAMRKYMLTDVDFAAFPPRGRYFNGIPVVTFEGMLMDIDSKIQLYQISNSYNIRSVGSLAAETTVGVLQGMSPTPQVAIKARDIPPLISSVVEVLTCKINPERGFSMRTSRVSGVYPEHVAEASHQDSDTAEYMPSTELLTPRDNEFDTAERKKLTRRKIEFGLVSGPMEPSRGARSVRQYHKTDESMILSTKRLGIDHAIE